MPRRDSAIARWPNDRCAPRGRLTTSRKWRANRPAVISAARPTPPWVSASADHDIPVNQTTDGTASDSQSFTWTVARLALANPGDQSNRDGNTVSLSLSAQYSGSAITAKLAIDQGREVFAIPGNITSKLSWGPNLLIKQGAKVVQDWNDVVNELSPDLRRQLIRSAGVAGGFASADGSGASLLGDAADEGASHMGGIARRVLDQLRVDTPVHLDDLIQNVQDTTTSELIAALFELEAFAAR